MDQIWLEYGIYPYELPPHSSIRSLSAMLVENRLQVQSMIDSAVLD